MDPNVWRLRKTCIATTSWLLPAFRLLRIVMRCCFRPCIDGDRNPGQISIAAGGFYPSAAQLPVRNDASTCAAGGFIVCVCIMHVDTTQRRNDPVRIRKTVCVLM